jgi:hypothetical protein
MRAMMRAHVVDHARPRAHSISGASCRPMRKNGAERERDDRDTGD